MIRDFGEKLTKAQSLDMNNTEKISLKVGALPHSTLYFVLFEHAVAKTVIEDWLVGLKR